MRSDKVAEVCDGAASSETNRTEVVSDTVTFSSDHLPVPPVPGWTA
jgi:hypothetical protein